MSVPERVDCPDLQVVFIGLPPESPSCFPLLKCSAAVDAIPPKYSEVVLDMSRDGISDCALLGVCGRYRLLGRARVFEVWGRGV